VCVLQVRADPKDAKEQARYLRDKYGFDPTEVSPKQLWAFGPDGNGPNWLMDATRAVAYLNDIKESVKLPRWPAVRRTGACLRIFIVLGCRVALTDYVCVCVLAHLSVLAN